jgi:PAS domain S-box-containing protein
MDATGGLSHAAGSAPDPQARQLQDDLAGKLRDLEAFARRAEQLQTVTAALTRAATVQEVADVVSAHGAELFSARASLLFLLSEDRRALDLVSFDGVDSPRVAAYQHVPIDANLALPQAVRTGEPVWLASHEEIAKAFPDLAGMRTSDGRLEGVVALPLRDTKQVIGGLAFSFYAKPVLDDVQRHFFLTVCSQCGLAVERARSFEAERRANERLEQQQQRLEVLARGAETLSSTLDSRHALAELAKLVVPTLADWCAIDELAPDGGVRRLALAHRDPAKVTLAQRLQDKYPPGQNDPHGVPRVLRTGQTEFVVNLPDELLVATARDEEHLALLRSLQFTSFAVVPIKTRGRVLGALSLVSEGRRRLVNEDVHFAEELARRAALALENARLYEAAEAARTQLHGLFMQAPAAISVGRGREHRYELANEPYLRLVGRNGDAAPIGRTLREVFPGPDAEGLTEAIERVYDTGESYTAAELPMRPHWGARSEGDERFFNVVYQPTRDALGVIDGVATFAFEVTDQVNARKKLEALAAEVARSESRMRALVEATAAIVWTATPAGAVIELSPSWLAFTGQSEAEYLNGGFLDAIHPDDRDPTMAIWTTAVTAGAPYAAEYRLKRRDGSYAHTFARGMPVRSPSGAVVEYIGCNVDVTELRLAERTAREHAETLATINDLGKVIGAELDTQKVVQAVTDAATELTGAQFGAFFYNVIDQRGGSYMLYTISGVPREHFSKFPMPRNTAVFAPTFAGEGIVRVDDITKDPRYGKNAPHKGMPEGHLPVRSYLAVPVTSRSGKVIGGIFLGHASPGVFTERAEALVTGLAGQAAVAMDNARLYGDAQRLIKALETTNRELDQFAYVTSHDLKAPLRGIGSLAEWIEEDLGANLTDDGRRKMELLRGRVRRMEALIQGILDFSRVARTTGSPEETDVSRLIAEVTEMLGPKPPAIVSVAPGLPVLHTTRVALQQVFMNLIGNALKHAARPDVEVRIESRDAGEFWEFRVIDNGPGVDPAYHERIWGIFQTLEARDKVENTGIGLAIVKKIVEGRQGRAWIESAEGQGATLAFTWPKREDRKS